MNSVAVLSNVFAFYRYHHYRILLYIAISSENLLIVIIHSEDVLNLNYVLERLKVVV